MSLIKEKISQNESEKQAIIEKIDSENIAPSQEEQDTANEIINKISKRFAERMAKNGANLEAFRSEISNAIWEECEQLDIPFEGQKRIEKIVSMTVLGSGPIEKYIQDPEVTEIVVQRFDNIVIEKDGRTYNVDTAFTNEDNLRTIIQRIVQRVGREINLSTPIVDARLLDGSRVNATIPPISPDGATMTIRKFNNDKLKASDYLKIGSLNQQMLYFLERCVKGKMNIFISGGTGTGKTTLLNMLSQFIQDDELIITIEDTLELQLRHTNVRRMEVRTGSNKDMIVDQKALVKAALRQRPDRIILGETRDGSIVDLVSAMSTGHEGSMSTIHANSPQHMCNVRVPILYSMNDESSFSERSIALQIAEAIQIVVQLSRYPDGSRKISKISQVDGVDDEGMVCVRDIFIYSLAHERFEWTGYKPEFIIGKICEKGYEFDESIFE